VPARPARDVAGAATAFAARLATIAGTFALSVLFDLSGNSPFSGRQLTALYALVLAGFLMALAYFAVAAYGRSRSRGLQFDLWGDGLLVTGLVYCSGGPGSPFGFFYILWVVQAAARAGSAGAAGAAAAATVGFGAIAWGPVWGWLPAFDAAAEPSSAAAAFWVHATAFGVVAALARQLSRELERRQAALLELGELHRNVFENVSSGLLTVDALSRITSFNPEAERITGYRDTEVLGTPLGDLFPTLAASGRGDGWASADGVLARLDLEFEDRDGEDRHLGFSRSPLRDASGLEVGAILIFQDVTNVVRMQAELRRSERLSAVGTLAAGLAHEIRNPLASLAGAIELLGADLPGSDKSSRRLLRIVERETQRLKRLLSDFLSYAGAGPRRREPVGLREMLDELAELLHADVSQTELVFELDPDLCVHADPDQLRQVLWNLVLNAVEAEPADGPVVVRAEEADGQVRIEVQDSGPGMPSEVIERAFEPFYTTKPKGTGLGLATVHQVVEAHGGSLEISSRDGHGTCVSLLLPVPSPAESAFVAPESEKPIS